MQDDFVETLAPEAASVSRARRLVADALQRSGHDDLVDVATLLVSEIVTNAVLHAGTSIALRCRSNGPTVRVEVRDGSQVLPGERHYDTEATTGRGMALVSALAGAWGLEPDGDGKTVWFELFAPAEGERITVDARTVDIPHSSDEVTDGPDDHCTVRLEGAPVALVQATIEYGDAVLRELALLSLGGDLDVALPDGWHLPQIDVTPILDAAAAAREGGQVRADLDVRFLRSVGSVALERMRLIDHADALAREGRLLSAPAVPEIGYCRHWMYSSISEQLAGATPIAWQLPDALEPTQSAASLPDDEFDRVRATTAPTIVADDANRILIVNDAAGALLGWEPDVLCGMRLTTIIPPDLREAHLAGFTRLQTTGVARIIDTTVVVPALKRDGTTIEVSLTIEALRHGNRTSFRATLLTSP